MVNKVEDTLIDLGNVASKTTIPENENPDKIIDITEKILEFNKQRKRKELKILTPKQML